MSSWADFEDQAPEIAAFGRSRFSGGVGYLATVRQDGSPRVHPVTPIIGDDLYVFMEPTSPKGRDLERDPRYALHCAVEDNSGGNGEFYVMGQATRVHDAEERAKAVEAASYSPKDRYILFKLTVERAFMNQYSEEGSNVKRWKAS